MSATPFCGAAPSPGAPGGPSLEAFSPAPNDPQLFILLTKGGVCVRYWRLWTTVDNRKHGSTSQLVICAPPLTITPPVLDPTLRWLTDSRQTPCSRSTMSAIRSAPPVTPSARHARLSHRKSSPVCLWRLEVVCCTAKGVAAAACLASLTVTGATPPPEICATQDRACTGRSTMPPIGRTSARFRSGRLTRNVR